MQKKPVDPRREFRQLMAALRRDDAVSHFEVVDAEAGAMRIAMTIGQADVTLTHAGPQRSHIDLEFTFGPMPVPAHDAALQLLALNAELWLGSHGGFGVDSAETVIYRCRQPLGGIDVAQLQAALMEIGESAIEWFDRWHGRKTVNSASVETAADNSFSMNVKEEYR